MGDVDQGVRQFAPDRGSRGSACCSNEFADTVRQKGKANLMPRILAQLLAVELLLHSFVEVEGQCFLELFAGQAVLILALIFKNVPCCKPWDSKWGEHMDVLKHAEQLHRVARSGRLGQAHLGTPCQSMSWARSPAVRAVNAVRGLCNPTAAQHLLVQAGNSLADFTMYFGVNMYIANCLFSVENPKKSWLWCRDGYRMLYMYASVNATVFPQKHYGTPYNKSTIAPYNNHRSRV